MPFQPGPEMLAVEVRMLLDGQEVENTFGVSGLAVYTPAACQLVVTAIRDYWITDMLPLQSNLTELVEVYGADLSSASGFEVQSSPSLPAFGTYAGTKPPNNVTVAVSLRTAKRGRSFRGRNFWVGMTMNAIVDNDINEAWKTQVTAAYVGLFAAVKAVDGEAQVGVLSRRANKALRPQIVFEPYISAVIVDDAPDSQRRRLPKRGR